MSVNRVLETSSAEWLVEEYKRGSHPHLEVPEISVEEFVRRRPTETVIIRGGRIIEYHEGYEELSKSFESEEELLRSFKGNKFADAAFTGYRYDQLYPRPQKTNYYKLNFGLKKKNIVFPVLLVNQGWAFTGWHVDSDAGADIVSQLQRGSKLWMFATNTYDIRMLTNTNKGYMRSVPRSLPSTLKQDIDDYGPFQYCVQEPGDVVFFKAKTCHVVLSGPEPNSLITATLSDPPDVLAENSRVSDHYQSTGQRRPNLDPGSRKRTRGQKKKRFASRFASRFAKK